MTSTSAGVWPPARRDAPPTRAPAGGARAPIVATIAAVVAALATYALAVRLGFAYDDEPMLASNRLIHSLAELPDALARPYWLQYGTLYRPLTTLAFGIDWAIGGGAPWLFHLMNVLWHAGVSALVVRLALRWLPPVAAGLAGVAFAVHPVHVEAVCNGVGRSELMSAAALLGVALVATNTTLRDRDRLLLAALLSFAALGAKEGGVVAPAIAAAGSWVVVRDRARAARLALWCTVGIAPLLVARAAILGTLGGDQPHMAFQATSWWGGLQLALAMLPRSVALMLVPQRPVYEYSPTSAALADPDPFMMALGVLLVVAGAVVVVRCVRRPGWPAFCLLFAAVTLAPVSNLFIRAGIVLAERTLYAPSIGLVLLLATLAAPAVATLRPVARRLALGAAALWCGASAGLAWRDVPVWNSTASVVQAFTERNPRSYAGWMFLGNVHMLRNERPQALAAYQRALALFDRDHRLVHAAAVQMLFAADTAEAEYWFRTALQRWPAARRSRTVFARVLVARGRRDEAIAVLDAGLKLEPDQRGWVALRDSLRTAAP